MSQDSKGVNMTGKKAADVKDSASARSPKIVEVRRSASQYQVLPQVPAANVIVGSVVFDRSSDKI